jgi:hypothetical protein
MYESGKLDCVKRETLVRGAELLFYTRQNNTYL